MPRRVTDRQAGLRQRPDGRDPLMGRESRPSNSADTTTTIHQNRSHLQVTLYSTLHGVRWEILLIRHRYWSEIRLVSPHGSLTTRTNVPPDSAKAHLRKSHGLQVWREEDVNIADARLVGPFNFTLLRMPAIPNKRRATTKHNLVDSSIWTKLEAVLDEQGINRTSIHRIVPCNTAEMLPNCSHFF